MRPAGIDQKHPCSHFSLTWGDRAARCQHSLKRQGELDWGQEEQSVIFLLNLFEITGALSSRGSFFFSQTEYTEGQMYREQSLLSTAF